MRAIQITEFGGPEVLRVVDLPDPVAGPGQLLLDVTAAGVNYADTHTVEDSYLSRSSLPLVPGAEVVGRTADGRRVVALTENGGYAQRAAVWEAMAHAVPDGVTDGQALSLVVQGLTAWHLLRTSARLAEGESVVVHAAAGGTGSLAVQLAKLFGAGRVIATASTADKRALALELGADAAVDADPAGLRERLVEANGGHKVDVVLEMTGGPVFDASLAALAPFGRLVTYGMASRVPPTPLQAAQLMGRSRSVVGFWLMHCIGRPGMFAEPLAELMAMTADGRLRPRVGDAYGLSEAARAHEDLRARRTVGKLLLDPAR
ncbi:quinone oxidoreductase family protein [Streptacidiphilus griseoplanus]|uniref:quinone oxidoreductase family protein n=1 Tax=Peterkaempfera griseoplana TaxID=66896 RepID=UPI0006E3BA8B|nr:zinc-binding dehydrogenase [Peterkaempfera griseoplana]